MFTSRAIVVAACTALAAATAASADTVVYTFSGLEHGRIVTNQFAAQGLTISAVNPNRSFNIAAIFDTTRTGTADPDLQDPWDSGNLGANYLLGNVLIIAENNTGAGSGILSNPDDEGNRPAGRFIFNFSSLHSIFGFDFVDLESVNLESTSVEFFKGGGSIGSVNFSRFVTVGDALYDPTIVFGDNSANRISPIPVSIVGGTDFDRVVVHMGGSGAIDNITVPAPGAAACLGLGGFAAIRRRRR